MSALWPPRPTTAAVSDLRAAGLYPLAAGRGFQMHARWHAIVAFHAGDRGGAKPVIAEQNVAQSQDENAKPLCCGLWRGFAAHEASASRLRKNL